MAKKSDKFEEKVEEDSFDQADEENDNLSDNGSEESLSDSEETWEDEEKKNDVDEIIKDNKKSKEKGKETKSDDDWSWDDEEEKESKPGLLWKIICGVLLVLLVAAIFTGGFGWGQGLTGAAITKIDAEEKVLDYVNNNLLRPPFTAEVVSTEELDNLFKVKIEVAGQEVDSYLTKDGQFFFPQGFDLAALPAEGEIPPAEEAGLIEVSIDDDPLLGEQNAPVTLVEFSDFQCPFCQKGRETMKQVEEEYVKSGQVRIVFRDFPLGFHPQAQPAALAAECAHEQGKFWEYHDLLFENQESLSPENYKKWAADLKLDTDKFNDCFDSEKYKEEVEKDQADGESYGVSGTPAFFINGKMLSGAQPYSAFKQAIEETLKTEEKPIVEELPSEESPEKVTEVVEEGKTEEPKVEEPKTEEAPAAKEFSLSAKKWRFFDPQKPDSLLAPLTVSKGDNVKLVINSLDIEHSFELPQFQVSRVIPAQGQTEVTFTANKVGTFIFTSKSKVGMNGVFVVK